MASLAMASLAIALLMCAPASAQQPPPQPPFFTPGNLVVAVSGCGVYGGTPPNATPSSAACPTPPVGGTGATTGNPVAGSNGYGDDQGAPWNLWQYQLNAMNPTTLPPTFVNSLQLPQNISGANYPLSTDYGSQSEGTILLSGQLSGTTPAIGNGVYLTMMGLGLNAATFNTNPTAYCPPGYTDPPGYMFSTCDPENGNAAMAQSGSLTGQSYPGGIGNTPVPRVTALIDANGNVNSSTVLYNIFNQNDPRSAYTLDGIHIYVSGQGCKAWDAANNECSGGNYDNTGGVYLTTLGANNYSNAANNPTAITGPDNGPSTSFTGTVSSSSTTVTGPAGSFSCTPSCASSPMIGASISDSLSYYSSSVTIASVQSTSSATTSKKPSGSSTSDTNTIGCTALTPCNSSDSTRTVQIYNNTLYVSQDDKPGGTGYNRSYIGTLGSPAATSLYLCASGSNTCPSDDGPYGPSNMPGFGNNGGTGKVTISAAGPNSNGNNLNAGLNINLSPSNFFFASPTVLYVADTGFPKNTSNGPDSVCSTFNSPTSTKATVGDGGLQKWVLVSGSWTLAYTLYAGLNAGQTNSTWLNGASSGVVYSTDCDPNVVVTAGATNVASGLYGLAGVVSGSNVYLYATTYATDDLVQSYLYGITDTLAYTTASQASTETFTLLDSAPAGSLFRGVSFAPSFPNDDVEVISVPSGLSVTSNGTGCAPSTFTTPLTLAWTAGSACTLTVTPPPAATGVQYTLAWQDGTTSTTDSVIAPTNATAVYTATFTTQYELTTSATTGGTVSAGGYYTAGTNATITATPSAGYYFVNFTGTTTSTSNPLTLDMTAPSSITANFALQNSQTITFTQNAPASAAYNGQFTVAATASSGLTVTFTSSGSCSNSGATYTMTSGTGTCSVIANQAGNANYSAATPVTESVSATMAGGSGNISVTASALASSIYPSQGDTLSATVTVVGAGGAPAGTGETVSFYAGATLLGTGTLTTVDANDSSTSIQITGSLLTLGANSITAVYVGDANYSQTTSAAITVTLLSPLVNFGSSNVGTAATVQTLNYTFTSATTLTAVNILTLGAAGLDYTDGGSSTCNTTTAYTAGQSCVVTVAFTPTAPGARAGAVTLVAQRPLPLLTWYLSGVGNSGAVTIDPGTLTTTTLTGTQTPAGYGAAVDGAGNVYVVDHANDAVVELAAGTFSQSTVVSGLSDPIGVALDGAGDLYISNGSSVVMVPNENGTLNPTDQSTVNLTGLGSARGVAVDAGGDLYVADATNGNVVELSSLGVQTTIVSGLTSPHGVAVDAAFNVYVAANNAVTQYPYPSYGAGTPVPYGTGYSNPRGIAVDAAGAVYVADTGNNRIVWVSPGGGSQATLTVTGVSSPQGVAVDASDNLYVTDPSIVIQVNRTQAAQLNFPSTNVDSTSATQVVTVTDAGNQALLVSNLAISANFASEPSGGTDCTSSTNLSAGGQCEIGVAFAPTTSGALTGTVSLSDNALNNTSSTQTVPLSGGGSQVAQTINFSINAPASAAYGSQFAVAAAASSGLAVTFTSAGACSNVGATYTMTSGTGACSVIANQAGNTEYSAAPQITQTTNATTASQSITFGTLSNQVYGTTPPALSATASSGLAVSFASTTSTICTVSGTTVTLVSAGTCTIQATQAGNTNYAAAPSVNQSFSVTQASQTITFGALSSQPYGTAPFAVSATASSNLPVSFNSQTTSICTVSATTVTLVSAGTCTIQATQAGNTNYAAAPSVNQSFQVTQASQTITFGALSNKVYGTAPFTLSATASSGLAVSFASTTATVCTVSGSTVTLLSGGQCTIQATQAGNTNYAAAPSVNQSFQVTQASQTITFGALSSQPYGTAPFTVSATASSSLPVSFNSQTTSICTVSATTVTLVSAGTCTIQATQAGNTNYAAAPSVNQSFQVTQASQTITFPAPASPAAYNSSFAVSPTSTSGLTVTIAASGVCSISSGTVTMTSASGTCTLTASQSGNTNYSAAANVVHTVTATKATPTITWATPAAITYGTALSGTQLDATASVGGTFKYSPAAGTVLSAGTQTLSVTFTPTNTTDYTTATDSVTLIVNKATPTITWATPVAITYGTALGAKQLDATASVGGTFAYSPGTGTVLGAGTQTLSVTFTPTNTTDYTTATDSVTLTVSEATPKITWAKPAAITYGTALSGTQLDATASVAGTFVYSPAAGTVLSAGTQSLSVTFTPTNTTDYTTATESITLTVNQATPTITWAKPAAITYGTALSATQLDATASVAGTFVYSPAAGTVLSVGTHTLSVTFTPTNTTDYTTATDSVTLTVKQ
jgi:hypothetical protein